MPFESVKIGETCEVSPIAGVVNKWLKVEAVYRLEEGESENTAAEKVKAFIEDKQKEWLPSVTVGGQDKNMMYFKKD